ncbi:MAG: tetratricopeptide repeat protein, partial [Bacteroidota bacterium]
SRGLTDQEKSIFSFLKGTGFAKAGNYEKASLAFDRVETLPDQFQESFTFYKGVVLYDAQKEDKGKSIFDQLVGQQSEYSEYATFYLASIYYGQESYAKVVEVSQGLQSLNQEDLAGPIFQLVGLSHAALSNLQDADQSFEKAIQSMEAKVTADLWYQAGLIKMLLNKETKAVQYLTEAGIQSGEYSFLSALQLGRIFLRKRQYQEALASYTTYLQDQEGEYREEALYQAAKLSAILGIPTQAIQYIGTYKEEYNSGAYYVELEDLLLDLYLKTSNYQLAISLLEKSLQGNPQKQKVYQKISFDAAELNLLDQDYEKERSNLQKSLRYPFDKELENDAFFLLAENYFRAKEFAKAQKAYQNCRREAKVHYGLGYAFYNQRNYSSSVSEFRKSLDQGLEEPFFSDAYLRYADGLFTLKRFEEAIEAYRKVGSVEDDGVKNFQIAQCYFELDNPVDALRFLQKVKPSSIRKEDATFLQGLIHSKNSQYDQAVLAFSDFIREFPQSEKRSEAHLNRAISHANQGNEALARDDYLLILEKFMASEAAISALLALQNLERGGVPVPGLAGYISKYREQNPNDTSLEAVSFDALKGLYFDQKYEEYVTSYRQFRLNYPVSAYMYLATFYVAESHYRLSQYNEAIPCFEDLKETESEFQLRILLRLGKIYQEQENDKAAEDRINGIVSIDSDSKEAFQGRMLLAELYFRQQKFRALLDLEKQLSTSIFHSDISRKQIRFLKAKALLLDDQEDAAAENLESFSNEKGERGAEANYLLAKLDFDRNQFDPSLDRLFSLTATYGSYLKWINKAYLLIAEVYISKEELYQAKATLNSIIQHSDDENTRKIASQRLKQIEEGSVKEETASNE